MAVVRDFDLEIGICPMAALAKRTGYGMAELAEFISRNADAGAGAAPMAKDGRWPMIKLPAGC